LGFPAVPNPHTLNDRGDATLRQIKGAAFAETLIRREK